VESGRRTESLPNTTSINLAGIVAILLLMVMTLTAKTVLHLSKIFCLEKHCQIASSYSLYKRIYLTYFNLFFATGILCQ